MASQRRYTELLRRYFLPEWPAALLLLALVLGATAMQLIEPTLLAKFIDAAQAGESTRSLARIAVVFLTLAVVAQAVSVSEAYVSERLALTATNRLRSDLTRHCLKLDLSFHNEHGPGELIQRIEGDVASLANFFSRFLLALLGNVLLLAGVLVMITLIDVRLGAVLTVFSVLVLLLLYRMRHLARPHWETYMQAEAEQSGFLEEHLSATEDLRASGATGYAMHRFFEQARNVLHRQRRAMVVGALAGSTSTVLFTVGTAGALAASVWLFRRGEVTIGTVFLIFTYTRMLSRPIEVINRQIQDLQTASAAVGRVDELFEHRSAVIDGRGRALPAGALGVELEEVEFAYEPTEPVIRNVSIAVEPGRVLGLLGRTGSGKTTLTRLLLRFYDPQRGEVRIAGNDLRGLKVSELRDRIGLVTQEVQLFHASARDNLTFFDPSVPDERIVAILHDLGLGVWLDGLPDGLDTIVEFGGTGLSAGEAQLLAFARVFLRDPGLVILDEATSRLDPATEQLVDAATTRLFEGRTAIVIAHRLQTVLRADDIVVLEDGVVVEHGSRVDLVADPTSRFSRLLATGLEELLT